jgi:hypothetical protein
MPLFMTAMIKCSDHRTSRRSRHCSPKAKIVGLQPKSVERHALATNGVELDGQDIRSRSRGPAWGMVLAPGE